MFCYIADVSTQSYWNQYLANHGHIVYQLPLDVILKNSVALSYLLDFMAIIGSQSYIFFLLNVDGKYLIYFLFSCIS